MNDVEFYLPFMQHALRLARNAERQTVPNPSVGAVLLRKDVIVAEGWHKGPGHPHAEIEAIQYARSASIPLHECTLVVTLEPCRHYGKTPPCTEAILEAGIPRLVVGALDPNPEASGGAEYLRSCGLEVITGVGERECLDAIDDFITWHTTDKPYTIIKLARTLDGRMATRTGHSRWISSESTRKNVHQYRRKMHAIIVGGKTFYSDDPQLTCRDPETNEATGYQPLAIVLTSRLPEAGSNHHLIKQRPEHTIFWTTIAAAASPKAEALRKLGVRVMGLPFLPYAAATPPEKRSQLDLSVGFTWLRKELGCLYVLCEGGGKLALSLLEANLAQELQLHLAPKILGDNEATPLFDGRSPNRIDEAFQLRVVATHISDSDIILTLKPGLQDTDKEGESTSCSQDS